MEVTNLRIEKQIKKAKAEVIVRQELSTIQFDTTVHKKLISFITITIALGAFWVWCSSSPESNYAIYINEHEWTKIFLIMLPVLLDVLWGGSIVISAVNIKKKISFEFWMSGIKWKQIYQLFILEKLNFPTDTSDIIKRKEEIKKIYEKHDDIIFSKDEFVKYLEVFYSKFKVNLSFDFFEYLADIILINGDLQGTLICESNDYYTFVVEKNREFISIVSLNSWR